MFDSRDRHPALLPATAEDKNRLRSWLADLRPSGGTDPYEALRVGIKLQPSAIFLLSDGRFTGSRRQRRVIPGSSKRETIIRREDPAIRDLAGLVGNPDRIPIHTVAFEELKAQENLKELSQLSSGQFRFVRAPLGIPEHMNADARERTAAHWMAVANELEAQSRPDMAQLYYQKILDNFASTRAAREAGRRRKRVVLSSHPTWVGSDRDKPKDLAATGRSTVSPQD